VDIVYSIQQCPSQFVALLLKQLNKPHQFKHVMIFIPGVCFDHLAKYDVNILTIELPLIIQHLSNGSPIPLESVSFRFGWMNCNPLDATVMWRSQSHGLGIEPHLPH
jgi:hypothetical protein